MTLSCGSSARRSRSPSSAPATSGVLSQQIVSEMKHIMLAACSIAALALVQPPIDAPLSGLETMIPMRDGVRLYTQVYAPKQAREPLPIILLRTPYGTGPLNPARVSTALAHLV